MTLQLSGMSPRLVLCCALLVCATPTHVRLVLRGEAKSGTTWAAFMIERLLAGSCARARGGCCVARGVSSASARGGSAGAATAGGVLFNFSACDADALVADGIAAPSASREVWFSTADKHGLDVAAREAAPARDGWRACAGRCHAESALPLLGACVECAARRAPGSGGDGVACAPPEWSTFDDVVSRRDPDGAVRVHVALYRDPRAVARSMARSLAVKRETSVSVDTVAALAASVATRWAWYGHGAGDDAGARAVALLYEELLDAAPAAAALARVAVAVRLAPPPTEALAELVSATSAAAIRRAAAAESSRDHARGSAWLHAPSAAQGQHTPRFEQHNLRDGAGARGAAARVAASASVAENLTLAAVLPAALRAAWHVPAAPTSDAAARTQVAAAARRVTQELCREAASRGAAAAAPAVATAVPSHAAVVVAPRSVAPGTAATRGDRAKRPASSARVAAYCGLLLDEGDPSASAPRCCWDHVPVFFWRWPSGRAHRSGAIAS